MAKNNFFDVLVVREIDRLSRSLAKQLIIEEELKRNGIRIEYVLGDYSDTPEGILNKNIKAVIAEYERLKISERMIRGRRLKVRSGSVISHGNAPFGYKIDSSDGAEILVIDESAARVIRMIFDLYTSGENDSSPLSINGITRKLTTLNIPTPSDVNKYPGKKKKPWGQWSSATVNKIIRNKTYVGEWLYGKSGHYPKNGRWERKPDDNLLAVEVPPIIQEDVWHIAQERLAKNREKSKRNLKYDYLLSKRVTCGLCGHKISGIGKRSRGRLYQYYRCLGSMKSLQMASDCTAPHFRSNVVDRLVWSWVKDLLINPDRLEDGYKAFVRKSEIENEPIKERMNLIEYLIAENQQQLDS